MKAELRWLDKMQFECINRSHKVIIDATVEHGGNDAGPSPKELVLDAMMGCTAMDVVSILKKMRQDITTFTMNVSAEKTTEHPVHFKSATLNFYLNGNLDIEKVKKAVDSSLTKYCGVNYMISKSSLISFVVYLNDSKIYEGGVKFN